MVVKYSNTKGASGCAPLVTHDQIDLYKTIVPVYFWKQDAMSPKQSPLEDQSKELENSITDKNVARPNQHTLQSNRDASTFQHLFMHDNRGQTCPITR